MGRPFAEASVRTRILYSEYAIDHFKSLANKHVTCYMSDVCPCPRFSDMTVSELLSMHEAITLSKTMSESMSEFEVQKTSSVFEYESETMSEYMSEL